MTSLIRLWVCAAFLGSLSALAAEPKTKMPPGMPTPADAAGNKCNQKCAQDMQPCLEKCRPPAGKQDEAGASKCMQKCAEAQSPCFTKCSKQKN